MSVKKKIKLPPWVFGLAGAALWFVIGAAGLAVLKSGGTEIAPKEFEPRVTAPAPIAEGLELDIALLKRNFIYADAETLSPNDSLLIKSNSNAPPAKLQPVFNAVFSKEGLQIASLKDSRLKCRAEAITPLSEMLGAFYAETGLRTIMINAAYKPYSQPAKTAASADGTAAPTAECGEHNNGYSFDLGIYIKDDDSRRGFSFDGEYNWFAAHAWEYGFIQRYPIGAEQITGVTGRESHFRYVGRVAAKIIYDNSLCFDQLAEFIRGHTIDDPLVLKDGGYDIVVYYHKLDDSRQVPVPATTKGESLPCEAYFFGKGQKAVIAAVRPTEEFYTNVQAEENTDLNSIG